VNLVKLLSRLPIYYYIYLPVPLGSETRSVTVYGFKTHHMRLSLDVSVMHETRQIICILNIFQVITCLYVPSYRQR